LGELKVHTNKYTLKLFDPYKKQQLKKKDVYLFLQHPNDHFNLFYFARALSSQIYNKGLRRKQQWRRVLGQASMCEEMAAELYGHVFTFAGMLTWQIDPRKLFLCN
jgi:hypothetical protein